MLALVLSVSFAILQSQRVQTLLAQKFAEKLSRELHTHVSIGKLRITPLLSIVIEDLKIHDKQGGPFVVVKEFTALIGGLKPASKLLYLKNLQIDSADIRIVKHQGDSLLNYHLFTDYFSGKTSSSDISNAKPWTILCSNLSLKRGHFVFNDQNMPPDDEGMAYFFIEASNIASVMQNIEIDGDTFDFKVKEFSATEKGGMEIDQFTGKFRLTPKYLKATEVKATSPLAKLDLDFTFKTDEYEDWYEFIDSVYISGNVRYARLNLTQFLPFSTSVKGLDNWIEFTGNGSGTVSNLKGNNIMLKFGSNSLFEGDVRMTGLPEIEETYMNIGVKNFTTTIEDVEGIAIGVNESVSNYFVLPRTLKKLGYLKVKGNFTGFYNDFVSNADFMTGIGNVSTDLSLKQLKGSDFAYAGHIKTTNFDLGKLFDLTNNTGLISVDARVNGQGFDFNTAVAQVNGTINSLTLNNYAYTNTTVNVELAEKQLNGSLEVKDPNLYFAVEGSIDMTDTVPDFNFVSEIKNARLQKLNLIDRNDSLVSLSVDIRANFQASGIDNMIGMINLTNLRYTENQHHYKANKITLSTTAQQNGNKSINLISDFLDVDIRGLVHFDQISSSINLFIQNYLYSFKNRHNLVTEDITGQNFSYNVYLKNIDPISKLFFPWIRPSHHTRFQGFLDSKNRQFRIEGQCDTLFVEGTQFVKWKLNGQTLQNLISVHMGSEKLILDAEYPGDTSATSIDSVYFVSNILNDSIFFKTGWNEKGPSVSNMADINGNISFSDSAQTKLKITSGKLTLNDSLWHITENNMLAIDSMGYHFTNLGLAGNNQKLLLNGVISSDSTQSLLVSFDNFNLHNFNYILNRNNITIGGTIHGDVTLADLLDQPLVNSALSVRNAEFNKQKFGDITINSDWNPANKALYIDAQAKLKGKKAEYSPFTIKGYYYPTSKTTTFNIDANLQNINIAMLNSFTEGIISDLNGFVSGDFNLSGTKAQPNLNGILKCIRTEFRVDYLNTAYSFTDDITVSKNQILIENLEINDSIGNKAYCNGKITHNYLKNFALDLSLTTDGFSLLNTNSLQNAYYYGSAIGQGKVKVHGPIDNIVLDAQITATHGTDLFLPLNSTVDIQENSYVTFIKSANDSVSTRQTINNLDISGFSLNFDLGFRPEARLNIELPSESGSIVSKGEGNIKIGINSKGDFGITGGYTINSGTFVFKIKNVLGKVLEIQKGSHIRFNGDPYDAEIDMSAYYLSKTTLNGLDLDLDSAQANARIPVKSILWLKNKIINPEIKFSILFPKIGEDIKQVIYTKLDTTNEMIMTQQFISLVVLNSFSFTSNYTTIGSSLGASSFQLVSNQINNLLSQISKDFDIGINYRPGDALSPDELEVMMKLILLDDRVTIDGNLGVSSYAANSRTSNVVGDILVEVKLSDDGRFRVKAFNRSNNIDMQRVAAPYTQGVGVFFRKEFNNWGDLFRKKKKSPPADYEVKL